MTYKGFTVAVSYDTVRNVLIGTVPGTIAITKFSFESINDLETRFHEAVDDYLELCKRRGIEPQKQYSGKSVIRFGSSLHWMIAVVSEKAGMSMNDWIVKHLKTHAEEEIR